MTKRPEPVASQLERLDHATALKEAVIAKDVLEAVAKADSKAAKGK